MGFRFHECKSGFPVKCVDGLVTISFYDGQVFEFELPKYIGTSEEDKFGIALARVACNFSTGSYKVTVLNDGVIVIRTLNDILYDKFKIELPKLEDYFILIDGGHIRSNPARDDSLGMDRNRWYNGRGMQAKFLRSKINKTMILEDPQVGFFYKINFEDERNKDFINNYFSKTNSSFPVMARTMSCAERDRVQDAYFYYDNYTDYYAKGRIYGEVINNAGFDDRIKGLIYKE